MDIVAGQEVLFTQPMFHKGQGLVTGTATKVGTKYITVKGPYREFKFDKRTLREVCDSNYYGQIYPSREVYQEGIELANNKGKLRDFFRDHRDKLTLEQTREILRIIKS